MDGELVLVTGGSGFIGVHCILQLLDGGYRVRTTVRSAKREADVKEMLAAGECKNIEKLEFAIVDLMKDEGWPEAVKDCAFVLHVASPFPPGAPKHEDDLIKPAREGSLRVLKAARDGGVKRVVLTSSFAAIGYVQGAEDGKVFTEKDWTDITSPTVQPYAKSKTLAERAAWDFMEKDGGSLELAVVNPVGVFGPVFGKDYSTSILLVERFMNGSVPACPRMVIGAVDVRDVADLHIRAMVNPKAKGERFLCSGSFLSLIDMAKMLKERMGKQARKVPTRAAPNFLLRFLALFDAEVALLLPELGKTRYGSNEKAKELLGWNPRSGEDSIVATGESLYKVGVLKSS